MSFQVPVQEWDHSYIVVNDGEIEVVDFNLYQERMGVKNAATLRNKMRKRCLAGLLPLLRDTVEVVTIVAPRQHFLAALVWACHNLRDTPLQPIWTNSGGKHGTYYMIPATVYDQLAQLFDQTKDAERFAAYIGLLFSDLAPKATLVVPAEWKDARHGEDGNGPVSKSSWGSDRAGQTRILLVDLEKEELAGLGKAMFAPTGALVGNEIAINNTMIKWAVPGANGDPNIVAVVAKTAVEEKPVMFPATFELIQLLSDVPPVREFLKRRVQAAVDELLDLVTKDNIPELVRRLGSLRIKDGVLLEAARNALSALRADFPWCLEIEQRLGRIFVRDIIDRVAPSAGLTGWGYLALQHDEFGVRGTVLTVIQQEIDSANPDARERVIQKWVRRVKSLAYRIPLTSPDNIVCFGRKLRNGRVHPDVMTAMDGDSDGDYIVVITDSEVIEMFLRYSLRLSSGHKPEKTRNESPMSPDRHLDLAQQVYEDGALVGILTMYQHYLIYTGDLEKAAYVGWLAQMSPMFLKWDMTDEHGNSLRDECRRMASEYYAIVAARKRDGLLPIAQWKVKQDAARECNSPRELYHLGIRSPQSLNDHLWNWTIQRIRVWYRENQLAPLSLPTVARLSWQEHPGMVLSGSDHRWARKVITTWGKYWEKNYGVEGKDHSVIYKMVEAFGRDATVPQLVALLLWRPASGLTTGFALKWHTVGTRWEEVLGLRPEVKEAVESKILDAELERYLGAAVTKVLGV